MSCGRHPRESDGAIVSPAGAGRARLAVSLGSEMGNETVFGHTL